MKIKYVTLLMFLLATTTQAQQTDKRWGRELVSGIQNLRIGENVPNLQITKIINNNTPSAKISDFKNQLLILDFWDTSCSACIKGMPKLDSLQRKFGNKVKILSVTWQKESEIIKFFDTNRFLKSQKIPVRRPSVVEDRMLGSYFRHIGLPHVVWINKGSVVAITTANYVSEENIQTILDGKVVNWPFKNDSFNAGMPFVKLKDPDQYPQNSKYFCYSVLTGQTNATSDLVGGINFMQDTVNHTTRIALFNQSILDAYKILSFNSDSIPRKFILTPGRIVLEVKDPSKYIYNSGTDTQTDWNRENQICYEMMISGLITEKTIAKKALGDLNNKLGLHGRWEKRNVKCLVFVKTEKPISDTLAIKKGGRAVSIISLMTLDMSRKYPPAIDETNFTGGLKMEHYDGTLVGLRREIQRHGLDLIEANREIEVLVITEINYDK